MRLALIAHDRKKDDMVALARSCDVHNVPRATNLSTASHLLAALAGEGG